MNLLDLPLLIPGCGLLGMFSIALLEKLVPIAPSHLILILLGMSASSQSSLAWAVIATSTGSLLGTTVWYKLGRTLGEGRVQAAVAKYGRYVFLRSNTYERLAHAYRTNHFLVTMFGQLIPVARIFLALPAGVLRLRSSSLLAAAAIGILVYNGVLLTIGAALQGMVREPGAIGVVVSIVLVAVEAAIFASMKYYQARRAAL